MEKQTEKTIYFAGGCFWGTEHLFSLVPGVGDATSGYANGNGQQVTYQQVVAGNTGYKETVKVTYDPALVSLEELLHLYYASIDPQVQNQQGNDRGSQYQTGIYFADENDRAVIEAATQAERAKYKAFFVEVEPLRNFIKAEDYHQDYLVKNPGGYCHVGPEEFELAKKTGKPKQEKTVAKAEYRTITPEDAKALMDKGEALIIADVRTPGEFAQGHIPGAVNVPIDTLPAAAAKAFPDKNATVLIYCRSGSRSRIATQMLVAEGYTGLYDLGGIMYWPYDIAK